MNFNGKTMSAFMTVTPAAIDDGVIAENRLWSSKQIVDALCPAINERGSVVQCEPLAGYPMSVVSDVDAPTSKLILTRCGKNLYDKNAFTITRGKYIVAAGGTTGSTGYACIEGYMPVAHLRGLKITLNHPPAETNGSAPRMVFYTEAKDTSVIDEGKTNSYTTTVPNNANYMRFSVPIAYVDGNDVQIEIGGKVTTFEEYHADSWEVDVSAAIQPESFDWKTGIMREAGGEILITEEPPEILAVAGVNTFYSNTGATRVVGRGDLLAYIERKTNSTEVTADV